MRSINMLKEIQREFSQYTKLMATIDFLKNIFLIHFVEIAGMRIEEFLVLLRAKYISIVPFEIEKIKRGNRKCKMKP